MKVGKPVLIELLRPDREAGPARNKATGLRQHGEPIRKMFAVIVVELVGEAKSVSNGAYGCH
ncbi:hypothetical protein [Paraburkholderia franconis]|uniref:hypothetical protein n=1 Tax=Paraburkholderia franconis TaxID=2654983 RepID=UPI001D0F98E1|nr:hypothetical protein [Paraburkholderia franconis]